MCSRLINLPLNLESGGSDVDPGTLPLISQLTHMWLFVSNRAMEHQLVDFIWTNGRDVWCQFSFWFLLLSQLGESLLLYNLRFYSRIEHESSKWGALKRCCWFRPASTWRDCMWPSQVFKHGAWTHRHSQLCFYQSDLHVCFPVMHERICF